MLDATAFKDQVAGQVRDLLALVFVLLSMAFLIALLGIANALSLSVHERTRELGLLRAVGMSRRSSGAWRRREAAVVAVLGTVLGLGVGVFFGWAMVRALRDEGIDRFALGVGLLVAVVAASAVAGILAALRPRIGPPGSTCSGRSRTSERDRRASERSTRPVVAAKRPRADRCFVGNRHDEPLARVLVHQ